MTHDDALQLLSAQVDGELTPDQERLLDLWMRDNPDGKIIAEAFRSQDAEVRRAFEERRNAALATAERVSGQLPVVSPRSTSAPIRRSRWRHLRAILPPLAAVFTLSFVALYWLRLPPPASSPDKLLVQRTETPLPISGLLVPRAKPASAKPALATPGQTIATKPGEKRRVVLSDSSIVYLNQNTTLHVDADRHVKLERGEIFVEAVRADETADQSYFEVETSSKKLKALGTKFAVDAADKAMSLFVTQGSVQVEGSNEAVQSGQMLKTEAEKTTLQPARRASHDLDWTRELMIAADSPLVPSGKYESGSLVARDAYGQESKLSLVKYHVDVHIEDGFARTTIDQTYFNYENMQMEGTFYFPLPPDASLSRLAMYVANGETCDLMEGGMAERDYARQTYEKIRHARRDPALLEWVDGSLFKMRVFPLEARQEKRLILSYTQKLADLYGRTTYRFPAGHSLGVVRHWSFQALVKGGAELVAASSSHPTMKIARSGNDLVLQDKAEQAKIDRDIVFELTDPHHQIGESVRWNSAEHEGAKYLMLRYRPVLQSAPRRERRDWVFLFEASGARDPLVARAQVEVIRSLLNNAEHDDAFALLTAGTRIHKFSEKPLPVTRDNVESALSFLEKTHLIGALNLEQALIESAPYLQAGENPHLVHVGGGIATLGEQRSDKLIALIPRSAHFVGVAVGKRFSPAFLKVAAEKSGGFFTQINPDEPIAWRGFELASTLNTPRLLDITVHVPSKAGEEPLRLLPFTNAISHGEEFTAVARVEGELPSSITIRGTLNETSFERKIDLKEATPGAGYLPRTWAKLEIDRLLAEDANRHRQRIIELSKAMYVMTPFTSLLVLENEAMYKEFKVDRGRKDHWAMYSCPEKIPVVYVPDPNQPADRNAPEFVNSKPHENVVLQTILSRTPPRYLTWSGRNNDDVAIRTAGQHFAESAPPAPFGFAMQSRAEQKMLGLDWDGIVMGDNTLSRDLNLPVFSPRFSRMAPQSARVPAPVSQERLDEFRRQVSNETHTEAGDSELVLERLEKALPDDDSDGKSNLHGEKWGLQSDGSLGAFGRDTGLVAGLKTPRIDDFDIRSGAPYTYTRLERSAGENGKDFYLMFDPIAPPDRGSFATANFEWNWKDAPYSNAESEKKSLLRSGVSEIHKGKGANFFADVTPRDKIAAVLQDRTTAPQYYSRPSFNGQDRVFSDLAAYAPGMSSSNADIQAVLEAEAAPRSGLRKGTIDPAARQRIEMARGSSWQSTQLRDETGSPFAFQYDGQGRYVYERRVTFGLVERVVCDGATIVHLYPELGIGARRQVSRFHRQELSELLPGVLPPADDLAYGADVKLLDPNTVAIIPLQPTDANERGKPKSHLELHLFFQGQRLSQRQLVLMQESAPRMKTIAREVFEPKGKTTIFALVQPSAKDTALDKLIEKEVVRNDREECDVLCPNLTPDVSSLVILPLPLRSREVVYKKYDLNLNQGLSDGENACFEYLSPEAALELLACEVATNSGNRVAEVYQRCFATKGDERPGFFTLMQSSGYSPTYMQSFHDVLRKQVAADRITPLMRYLSLAFDNNAIYWQRQLGLFPGPVPADNFLDNLLTFRALSIRWQGLAQTDRYLGDRAAERRRAIAFARQNVRNAWSWCTLGLLADRAHFAGFHKDIADAWGVLAEKTAHAYHARYEQALNNFYADRRAEARQQFRNLFQETFARGVLPAIDSNFRRVFTEENNGTEWLTLIHQAAAKCIAAKQRPIVVQLAWQCRQLGDHPLADDLLTLALKDAGDDEVVATTLAAIEYLWSINSIEYADRLVSELLRMPKLQQQPMLYKLASKIAARRGQTLRQFEYLENALDLEFAHMPAVYNVEPVRTNYQSLLNHYEWLADAARNLNVAPPDDLLARTVHAADRWRSLDPETSNHCNLAAKILRKIGGREAELLAWDFLTTPLALKPNSSDPWLTLAQSAIEEGDLDLADRCYEAAFAAEPTNAQILWDRAKLLERRSEIGRSRELMTQLAKSDWQPRFEGLKTQARQTLEGR